MQELGYIEARYWVTPQEKKKLDAAFASVKQERTKKSRLEIALATMERSRNRSD